MSNSKREIEKFLAEYGREEYERGWRDAIAAVTARASELQQALPFPPSRQNRRRRKSPGRPARAKNLVKDTIASQPGLSGVAVVNAILETGESIAERTVRTNLRRLKLEGAIEQRDGKWFPKSEGEAPGTPPP